MAFSASYTSNQQNNQSHKPKPQRWALQYGICAHNIWAGPQHMGGNISIWDKEAEHKLYMRFFTVTDDPYRSLQSLDNTDWLAQERKHPLMLSDQSFKIKEGAQGKEYK